MVNPVVLPRKSHVCPEVVDFLVEIHRRVWLDLDRLRLLFLGGRFRLRKPGGSMTKIDANAFERCR